MRREGRYKGKDGKADPKGPVKYWEFRTAGTRATILRLLEVVRVATSAMMLDVGFLTL